eukprot:scaffold18209_cov33-Tisochrysis_lutea.AAC.4
MGKRPGKRARKLREPSQGLYWQTSPLRALQHAGGGGGVRERSVGEDLMIMWVGRKDRGVVLERILPPLSLDGLVAEISAHCRGRLNVLFG